MSLEALLLACLVLPAHAGSSGSPQQIEVLLNAPMAKLAKLGPLKPGLAVTPDRLVLLHSDEEFFTVGWGGIRPISGLSGLDAFAFAHDGVLIGVRKRELVYLDSKGALTKLFMLPSDGMGIVSGAGKRMFLFERAAGGKSGLYELLPGRKIVKILDSPDPIRAVAETSRGRVLFAVGGSLFEVGPDKKMRTVAIGGKPIQSVAAAGTRVFASDGTSVFIVDGKRITLITKQTGGDIQWHNDGLIVFDPKSPLLIRITGL